MAHFFRSVKNESFSFSKKFKLQYQKHREKAKSDPSLGLISFGSRVKNVFKQMMVQYSIPDNPKMFLRKLTVNWIL